MAVFLLLSCLNLAVVNGEPIHARVNYGTVFRYVDSFEIVTDYWFHTFLVNIPRVARPEGQVQNNITCPVVSGRPLVQQQVHRTCRHLRPLLMTLVEMSQRSSNHLIKTINHIEETVPSWALHQSRVRKRGLGSWLGEGISWTFGLAKQSDYDAMKGTIRHMAYNMDVALDAWHKISTDMRSYTVLNNKRVTNLALAVNETENVVAQIHNQLASAQGDITVMQAVIHKIVSKLMSYVALEDDYIVLYSAVIDLLHSRLSPVIIPPHVLHRVITGVHRELTSRFPRYKLLRHIAQDYYRLSDFMVTRMSDRNGHRLYITLRLPITLMSSHFKFYRLDTFPVYIPDNPQLATILTEPAFGIGIPQDVPMTYIIFHTSDQTKMVNGILDLTHSDVSLLPHTFKHCLMALFVDSVTDVNALCSFSVIHKKVQPSITHLINSKVALSNVETVKLICDRHDVTNVTGCDLCVFEIPCGCALVTPFTVVPASVSQCVHHVENTTVLHGINLIVLQQFFAPEQLGQLIGQTLLTSQLDTELPEFLLYKHQQHQRLASEQRFKYDLSKLSNLTKKDSVAFHSLAESLRHELDLDKENTAIIYPQDHRSWQFWLLVFAIICSVCAVVFTFTLWIRLRMLGLVVATSRALPVASAQIPTKLSYFLTSNSTPILTSANPMQSATNTLFETYFHVMFALLGCLVLLLLVIAARRSAQCYFRQNWHLCFNIGNETENVVVKIQSLPNSPYCYHFSAANFVQLLKINGTLFTILEIDWNTLQILYVPTDTVMKLRTAVHLSYWKARKIRRILNTAYWCYPIGSWLNQNIFLTVTKNNTANSDAIEPTAPDFSDGARQSSTLYPSLHEQQQQQMHAV